MAASALAERYLFPIVSISFISLLLFLSAISGLTASSYFSRLPSPLFVHYGPAHLPSFAYLITGSRGDGPQILRLLLAIYHPRNRYLLHLSHEATDKERNLLAMSVRLALPVARAFGNVDVVGKPDAMTNMGTSGPAATLWAATVMLKLDSGLAATLWAATAMLKLDSGLAATLWAATAMLKLDSGWDWFVILSATDYPLITQDGWIDRAKRKASREKAD